MYDSTTNTDWIHLHSSSQRNSFFGEVQHRLLDDGTRDVKLIIQPYTKLGFQLSRAALAIDGSKSIMPSFAAHLPPMLRTNKNAIHPVLQGLADNGLGEVAFTYWACRDDGRDIEPIGIMSKDGPATYTLGGPRLWGGGTQMTLIARNFWEPVFAETTSPGVAAIVTDGDWIDEDHVQLEAPTAEMCAAIEFGERQLTKLVVSGLRLESNANDLENIQARFTSLDDCNSGTNVNVWNHKWLDEIADINGIFVEMVQDWPLVVGGHVELEATKILETDEFRFGIQFQMLASSSFFKRHIHNVGDYEQVLD